MFNPTFVIRTVDGDNIPVQQDQLALYQEHELSNEQPAEWALNDNGTLTLRGNELRGDMAWLVTWEDYQKEIDGNV